jgi:hypothetical protein
MLSRRSNGGEILQKSGMLKVLQIPLVRGVGVRGHMMSSTVVAELYFAGLPIAYLLFCILYAFVNEFPANLSWSYFGSARLRLAETQ